MDSDSENESKKDENQMPLEQQAMEYLERHQIYELFANLTATLAIDRPSDVKQYLIQQLRSSQNHKIFLICNDTQLATKCGQILNSQLLTPIYTIDTDSIDSEEWNNKITALQKANKFILVNSPQNRGMANKLLECRIIPDRVLLVTRQPIEKVNIDCNPIPLLSLKDVFAYRTRFICVDNDDDDILGKQLMENVLSQRRSDNSKAPQIPPRVIIIGPLCQLNSKLGIYLENNLNLRYLHPNSIVQSHIASHSTYGKQVEKTTAPNEPVNDDLLAQMMAADITDVNNGILTNGWALIDYPRSPKQAQSLFKYGIQPSRVIIIHPTKPNNVSDISVDRVYRPNASADESSVINSDSVQQSWDENIDAIKKELRFKDSDTNLFFSTQCDPNSEKDVRRVFELARDFVVQPLPQIKQV